MTAAHLPAPTGRGPWRRIVTAFGLAMILAGLGVLVWFAWQYFGTNIVSKRQQAEIKQTLKIDWGKGIDSDAIGLLRVKRFGDDFEAPIVKGVDDGALARGVGWDTNSAKPGQIGNFVIAGHRVTHGEPFAKFPKLKRGDKVVVETRTAIYTYKLRNSGTSITVDFTTSWPLWDVPDPDARGEVQTRPVLTMLTCSELFHTRNRSVVLGDLVKTVKKTKDNTKTDADSKTTAPTPTD
ncbi:sortase domain-containing protein [Aeromicrobium stalagmiti]|uniref:sortase domain-containing protein n=1 Tax=Aeromicrobium stalagmiti TaxID=2738988 RepID=UPI001567DD98|nr:sortase [Aeromicrobium stalagmiti]NRQ49400.1 class E sortase [Aeromicrobium stalagmiti]